MQNEGIGGCVLTRPCFFQGVLDPGENSGMTEEHNRIRDRFVDDIGIATGC